jgi:hypothetical protein
MAIDANSARHAAWNTTYNHFLTLSQQLDDCPAEQRDALERAIADQEEEILETPSPSFEALRIKIELLFEGQLDGLHAEAEHRRLVLEDLSDLIAETHDLIGGRA